MLLVTEPMKKPSHLVKKYGIGKVYTDYNEMFTDRDVDVIISQHLTIHIKNL